SPRAAPPLETLPCKMLGSYSVVDRLPAVLRKKVCLSNNLGKVGVTDGASCRRSSPPPFGRSTPFRVQFGPRGRIVNPLTVPGNGGSSQHLHPSLQTKKADQPVVDQLF